MDETWCPSSDVESGGELDLATDWLKQAIQKEVFRGAKLREQKVRPPFDVTAKFPKPPTPTRSIWKDRRKPSPSPNKSNVNNKRERARSYSPFLSTRTSSPTSRRDSSSTSARRGRPVCSMRISELAVPTKRQCIDTWRNKSGVLPGLMVNRLKQQVMDQTPIVKVSDAINCFRQVSVSSKKRTSRKINKEAINSRNQEEAQYISTIFGHKIAQKLIKPVNAKLNSQLQNVSSIISNEICDVIKNKSKVKTDEATHEQMVRETADKVTIWIANILEESSEKLLEEDLRVKKVNEMTLATDGELITLIGTMVRQEAELEEQEGPALDILDELVDNVVSVGGGAESDLEEAFEISSSIPQKGFDEDNVNTGDISTPDYISASSGNNDDTQLKEISPVQEALKENSNELDIKSEHNKDSLILQDNTSEVGIKSVTDQGSINFKENSNEVSIKSITDQGSINFKENSNEVGIKSVTDQGSINFKENSNEVGIKPADDEDSLKDHLMKQLNEIIDSKLIDTLKSHDMLESLSNELDNKTESQTSWQEKRPESLTLPDIKGGENDKQLLMVGNQEYDDKERSSEKEGTPVDQLDEANIESEKQSKIGESMNDENNDTAGINEHMDNNDNDKVENNNILSADEKANDTIETEINKNEESNASEDLSEERDKKVQFSYDNFELLKEIRQHIEPIHSNKNSYTHSETSPGLTNANVTQEKKIGQPNYSGLRDVDEPWPEDLSFANLIKPAESVSKSVTSLGKLLESDERNYLSPEEETSSQRDTGFISQPHQESTEQFDSLGFYYDDFLGGNDENNQKNALSSKLNEGLDEIGRNALSQIGEHDSKDTFETVPDENNGDYCPTQVVETINQVESIGQINDGEFKKKGVSKPDTANYVEQQELSAQIKDKELDASLRQIKDEISKINIQKESSEPSLVSMMISKLKKYDDKLQDIISIREQSDSDISKMHTVLSERSKSAQHPLKRKLNSKIHQRHSRPEAMAIKKFDYRVHPNTAPAWIRRSQRQAQGDLGAYHKPMGSSNMKGITEREREILKWCKDLDDILLNLNKWKSWLDYITQYITSLKEKAELNKLTPRHNKTVMSDRLKLPRNMEKDAMWTKLNHRAKGGLKLYKQDETIKFKISPTATPAPAKYCVTCGCKKQMKRLSRSPTRK